MKRTIITGTGCYIPPLVRKNEDFAAGSFYTEDRQLIEQPIEEIIEKFRKITGIAERRYAPADMNTSGMAAFASKLAIDDSGIDPETIDQIIVAHNYGDLTPHSLQPDTVPSLASRVKHLLNIRNPYCIAYDILFGCPGWLQGMIQADIYGKAGVAQRCLVVGSETLSRILDQHDRDSMIFSDGAGACILEYKETTHSGPGVLGVSMRSDCLEEVSFINFGQSYSPKEDTGACYIKMKGRKVYEYALRHVPEAMKECLDRSGIPIGELKMIFIHQANEKMDENITKAFYGLYGITEVPEYVMPMSIHWLGNSSVATIPTLFDLVNKCQVRDHLLHPGDILLFASVGAGMNINAVCYRY